MIKLHSNILTVNKLTETLHKPFHYEPRDSHVTIYKSFIRIHLEHIGRIFDKPINATLSN